MLIDSGSTVNLLDEVGYSRLGLKLTETPTNLNGYGLSSLPVLGKITTDLIANNRVVYVFIYVVKYCFKNACSWPPISPRVVADVWLISVLQYTYMASTMTPTVCVSVLTTCM
jgi:hypothetical protein